MTVSLTVDGRMVAVTDEHASLLDVLREELGLTTAKDGCSPQGQCGCCTVLVDGKPRVACVTPVRRVAGRSITTLDGLGDETTQQWADAFTATGASQCGFCTPGIIVRLEGLRRRGTAPDDEGAVEQALGAHLCRCTGWRTIVEAYAAFGTDPAETRDLEFAGRRASLEGRAVQRVDTGVALGAGGFAEDTAPDDALVAVADGVGGWVVEETAAAARAAAAKVQGRRTTVEPGHPLDVPDGDWARTLRTTWLEPGYLELDASWCRPGGEPATPLANGGAFGGKVASPVTEVARRLADEHGRPVRVVLSREDAVRLGAKRPPMAAGIRDDGTGVVRVRRTPGIEAEYARCAPRLVVEPCDVVGPPTSVGLRAPWAEAAVLAGAVGDSPGRVTAPNGAVAEAAIESDVVHVRVSCGAPLDEVVLRSYCVGAVHQGLGWVTSEGIAVDDDGAPLDLTVRSFGILRATEMPRVDIEVVVSDDTPINGSDAVFAAVASAVWHHQGFPTDWPTGRRLRER